MKIEINYHKPNIKTKLLQLSMASLMVSCNQTPKTPPNVLMIAIDDLNDYVGCMNGAIKAKTPNIDKLASEAVLFTNAHCQAPISVPSRASIMTGMYPSNTGNYLQLDDENIKKGTGKVAQSIYMPDYFEQHGYKTMAVGKIFHHGDRDTAFDEYGGGFDWFGPRPAMRINYDPSSTQGKSGYTATDWGAYPVHDSLMTDYKVANWAIKQLNKKHDKPFFLVTGFLRPHVPWYVPQKWLDMFPLDSIQLPPYLKTDFDDIPEMAQKVAEAPMMPTTEELIASGEWRNVLQAYLGCIAFVDYQVGKVLDALENSAYANNTIVVLWADHGYHLGEKNRFAKQALWERDTRTILIFKDLQGNVKRIDDPAQLIDIYPSLLELCGLPKSDLLDGHSLKPLIDEEHADWNYPALSFYGEGNVAIRNKRYRLIRYEDGSSELYDMLEDPNEWTNIAGKGKYIQIEEQLKSYIPRKWAPLSDYSEYDFNEYFKSK